MDRDDLKHVKREVESLRLQNSLNRIMVSEGIKQLVSYIEEKTPDDGLVVAPDKKKNPWAETRKCEII